MSTRLTSPITPVPTQTKSLVIMHRWRMRDGSVGAWGETVSATTTG